MVGSGGTVVIAYYFSREMAALVSLVEEQERNDAVLLQKGREEAEAEARAARQQHARRELLKAQAVTLWQENLQKEVEQAREGCLKLWKPR